MKEKILDVLVRTGWDKKLNDIQQIADDYAIEFAEWLNTLEAKYLIEDLKIIGELNKNPTTKELLEIFKKEKGL